MKLSTPEQPKKPSPLKLLLMGDPGARKTTFMLQFAMIAPDEDILQVYDCDHNLDGASDFLRNGIVNKVTKEVIVPPPFPRLRFSYDDMRSDDDDKVLDIAECYDRVIDKLTFAAKDPQYQKKRIHGLDSLSHVNEFIIRKVMKMKSKTSMEINLWTDFASLGYTLLVAKLDQLNRPVICTVHQEKVMTSDAANIMVKQVKELNPLFSGRIGDAIGAFFTDVWRLEKRNASGGKVELWLQTDRSPKCEHLKNSVGLPNEVDVTKGFSVIEPYLKGRI